MIGQEGKDIFMISK